MNVELRSSRPDLLDDHYLETVKPLHPRLVYRNLFYVAYVVSVIDGVYFALAAVLTSLNGPLLGSVTLGVSWLSWFFSVIFGSVIVSFFGVKYTVLVLTVSASFYPITNFYPSWYTLVPGSLLIGLSLGPIFVAASSYATSLATQLAAYRVIEWSSPESFHPLCEKYSSRFQSIIVFGYYLGTTLCNSLSSVFLIGGDAYVSQNDSSVLDKFLVSPNRNGTSQCHMETSVDVVPDWVYYGLVSVLSILSLSSVLAACLIRNDKTVVCNKRMCYPYSCCRPFYVNTKSTLVMSLRSLVKPEIFFSLWIPFYTGVDQGFYFGKFTLYFTAECFGTGIVGLTVIAWGVGSMITSLLSEKISVYTSRTFLALTGGLLQAGMILFMLFWERVPSYIMVFLTSFGWGIVDGMWLLLPFIYIGLKIENEGKQKEAIFSLMWGAYAAGGTVGFLITNYVSVSTNLLILLVLLLASYATYIGTEGFSGEGRNLIAWCENKFIKRIKQF